MRIVLIVPRRFCAYIIKTAVKRLDRFRGKVKSRLDCMLNCTSLIPFISGV